MQEYLLIVTLCMAQISLIKNELFLSRPVIILVFNVSFDVVFREQQDNQDGNEETTSSAVDDDYVPIPVQNVDDDLEVLCARTEALHVHGYRAKAGKLAVKLAENILSNGTKLNLPSHPGGARNRNKGPGATSFTSTILVKAAFLCSVLEDDLHLHHLAFRVGMLGLEMPRQPARSKALEVFFKI